MILKDKKALITGGSQGIGKAAALKLASEGADIAIIHMGSEEDAKAVCEEIKAMGRQAIAYRADVADFAGSKEIVSEIAKEFGRVDILVNCAGITRDGLIAMMKEENFDAVIGVNLKGTFNMIKHCMPYFIKQRSGKIVNVSSVSGIMGNAGQANYSAIKGRSYRSYQVNSQGACIKRCMLQRYCTGIYCDRYDCKPCRQSANRTDTYEENGNSRGSCKPYILPVITAFGLHHRRSNQNRRRNSHVGVEQ